jgi:hypothetical protein
LSITTLRDGVLFKRGYLLVEILGQLLVKAVDGTAGDFREDTTQPGFAIDRVQLVNAARRMNFAADLLAGRNKIRMLTTTEILPTYALAIFPNKLPSWLGCQLHRTCPKGRVFD